VLTEIIGACSISNVLKFCVLGVVQDYRDMSQVFLLKTRSAHLKADGDSGTETCMISLLQIRIRIVIFLNLSSVFDSGSKYCKSSGFITGLFLVWFHSLR